jgi:hypothetical protein
MESNAWSRFKAKLFYNRLFTGLLKIRAQPTGNTVFEIPALRKVHYWSLLFSAAILGLNFYSGIKVTKTRGETFGRN